MVRNEIISSIYNQITAEENIIEDAEQNIGIWQDKLEQVLYEDKPTINDILLYSDEILSSKECDEKISIIMSQIRELQREKEELNLKIKNLLNKIIG